MVYEIYVSPHYKGLQGKLLGVADTLKQACRIAREEALKRDMVDIFRSDMGYGSCAVKVGKSTVYLVKGSVYKRIHSDGSLSSNVTQKGIDNAEWVFRHWM